MEYEYIGMENICTARTTEWKFLKAVCFQTFRLKASFGRLCILKLLILQDGI
jgi:hypothetical protein